MRAIFPLNHITFCQKEDVILFVLQEQNLFLFYNAIKLTSWLLVLVPIFTLTVWFVLVNLFKNIFFGICYISTHSIFIWMIKQTWLTLYWYLSQQNVTFVSLVGVKECHHFFISHNASVHTHLTSPCHTMHAYTCENKHTWLMCSLWQSQEWSH